MNESEPAARTHLARLAELGLVESRGNGRSRRHHLTAAGAHVRLQDTDPIQQDRMILAFVDEVGRITRGKAAELCHLTTPQARVALKRLVNAGELQMVGARRGTHYVRPR